MTANAHIPFQCRNFEAIPKSKFVSCRSYPVAKTVVLLTVSKNFDNVTAI